jgi:hypothetical protein
MGTYLKHKDGQPRKKRESKQPPQPQQPNTVVLVGPESGYPPSPSLQHDVYVAGLDGIEGSLDNLVGAVARLTHDDHHVGVAVCQNRYGGPVKLTLADNDDDDTMNDLVTALQRIADAVAKLAGLSRPRLESWHEQDTYEPRYKDTACDGGAPGPKKDAA